MRMVLALCLPHDAVSIPACRHVLRYLLRAIGVAPHCIDNVVLAQTEACTNVVEHAGPGEEYEVQVEIDEARCVVRVRDAGQGMDWRALGRSSPGELSERGRGIELMRAISDSVHFVSGPESGTDLRLQIPLEFSPEALIHAPAGRRP